MSPRRSTPVRAPEPGRFLRREGNLKVRRERRQRHLVRAALRLTLAAAALGGTAAAVTAGARWVTTTPALAVTRIRIEGAENADVETLRALASVSAKENLLQVDLDRVAAKVRTHPWVREVVIRKQFPDTLAVHVEERSPTSVALLNGEAFLMDRSGDRIDRYGPRYSAWSFPVLIGLDGLNVADRRGRCRVAGEQLRELRSTQPDLYARLAEVDLSDPGVTVLSIDGTPERLQVASEDWARNLEAYRALRTTLVERHGAMRYVDLRWNGRIAVMQADLIHP